MSELSFYAFKKTNETEFEFTEEAKESASSLKELSGFINNDNNSDYILISYHNGYSIDKVNRMIQELEKYPAIGLVYCDSNKEFKSTFETLNPMKNVIVIEKDFMIPTKIAKTLNFDHQYHIIIQIAQRHVISHIPEPLINE